MTGGKIELRKFPYPYQCALSICSDLDATGSVERFINIQKYICSDKETFLGEGLKLETGNSFWFYRNSDVPSFSYFEDLKGKLSGEATIISELIKSGHIDVLHSYGDFNNGGFERKLAERCLGEMERQNLKISVWVNHGNNRNSQNIGSIPGGYAGDDPSSQSYHMDITRQMGLRYYWISQLTHLVGQDGRWTLNNLIKNPLQKAIAVKNRGKQTDPFFNNVLMEKVPLRDESHVQAFVRFINPWGKYSYTDINNLQYQIGPKILDELISSQGYMILYTHLGNNDKSLEIMPPEARRTLEGLAERSSSGKILVATTARLLRYYEAWKQLKYDISRTDSGFDILIRDDDFITSADVLSGITFYSDKPEATRVLLKGREIPLKVNEADRTGRVSVSVRWQEMEFPL